jgi:hypothetical protein
MRKDLLRRRGRGGTLPYCTPLYVHLINKDFALYTFYMFFSFDYYKDIRHLNRSFWYLVWPLVNYIDNHQFTYRIVTCVIGTIFTPISFPAYMYLQNHRSLLKFIILQPWNEKQITLCTHFFSPIISAHSSFK